MTDKSKEEGTIDEEIDEMDYSSTGLQENTAGVVCYLGFFFTEMWLLFFEEESDIVRFHAMQSTLLFLSLFIIGAAFSYIPFGWIVSTIVAILAAVLWILLMIKGYQREYYKVPIIGSIAATLHEKRK